jgi:hypothetical protein
MEALEAYKECQECDREIQLLISTDYREENRLFLFSQKHRPKRKTYTMETDHFCYSTVNRIMESESCSFTRACEKLGASIHVHEKKVARAYKRGHQAEECLRPCCEDLGDEVPRREFALLAVKYLFVLRKAQRIDKILTEKKRRYKQLKTNR